MLVIINHQEKEFLLNFIIVGSPVVASSAILLVHWLNPTVTMPVIINFCFF